MKFQVNLFALQVHSFCSTHDLMFQVVTCFADEAEDGDDNVDDDSVNSFEISSCLSTSELR